jgi:Zn-dependent M16 (insulinase) family peptidase
MTAETGSCNRPQIFFNLESSVEKYAEAVEILRETLFNVEFTEERVRSLISQLLNGIPGEKLSASTVVKSLADNLYFNDKGSIFTKLHFCRKLFGLVSIFKLVTTFHPKKQQFI